jgi:hypothetical protein
MHIVFKDKFGDYKWYKKFEVNSLEEFVEKRNKRVLEMGSKRPTFYLDSPATITETEWDGKLKGTYHLCEKDIHRLL